MDEFIWLIHKKCSLIIEKPTVETDIINQCYLLAEYMKYCPTRVMASQVTESFIRLLVKVKVRFFRSEIKIGNLATARGVDAIISIFSELMFQSRFPLLDNLLFQMILDDADTWLFLRNYATIIMVSEDVEKTCYRTNEGKEQLNIFRHDLIQFYCRCVDLMQRLVNDNSTVIKPLETGVVDNLYKFAFLVEPMSGLCLRFLRKDNFDCFSVEKEIAEFLYRIFSFKISPWRNMKECVDTYIRYILITLLQNIPRSLVFCLAKITTILSSSYLVFFLKQLSLFDIHQKLQQRAVYKENV